MENKTVSDLLFLIDNGVLALPKFQRPFVWNKDDVKDLIVSLYKGYPVGSLLVWDTHARPEQVKGTQQLATGMHRLLLDGQQRITTLYGVIRGCAPKFSNADPKVFQKLYFNVKSEGFEFHSPRMKDDPLWISVTELINAENGSYDYTHRFATDKQNEYGAKLGRIVQLTNWRFQIESVPQKVNSLDEVVEIFNKVNSKGQTLSKGDLALAKISAYWPDVRDTMQAHFIEWQINGYSINDYLYKFDWLLRCINAILTGHSDFAELSRHDFNATDIQQGLKIAEKHINSALTLFHSRLGLDHRKVLGSPNALPAVIRLMNKKNGVADDQSKDRFLYWFVNANFWGRYSGSAETAIRQDLQAVDNNEDAVSALVNLLRDQRGGLRIEPYNLDGFKTSDRFYALLYMLTRVYGTRDLNENIGLQSGLYGDEYRLELHHIFPKSKLREYGYLPQKEANAVANFTFLFQKTNRNIGAKLPEVYFPHYEEKHPGVLASHWIPMDPELWKIENYRDFLAARRNKLAEAANNFLDELYHSTLPVTSEATKTQNRMIEVRPSSVESDEEEALLQQAMQWMEQQDLPIGDYGYELQDQFSEQTVTIDLAWPRGVKEGISIQAALLIDEDDETLQIASRNGYICFTTLEQLQAYVLRDILGEPA